MNKNTVDSELADKIEKAVPNSFKEKKFLLAISKMDLRHKDDPSFHNPDELVEILNSEVPFDLHVLQNAWNLALCDSESEFSQVAQKLVLTADQERQLFLRYNYCRLRLQRLFKKLDTTGFEDKHWVAAVSWGRKMKLARDILVISNLGLVFSMGRRYGIFVNSDSGELVTEGMNALMRAVDGFKVTKGFKFSTYACRSVISAMNRTKLKLSKRLQREFPSSLDITPESKVSEFNFALEEDISDLRQVWKKNAAGLSDNEQIVIYERFLGDEKKTLEEVGNVLDLTKERVRQIQNKALYKLKQVMSN